MKALTVVLGLTSLMSALGHALVAQGPPGTNADIEVTVVQATVAGNSVHLSYVVRNQPTSGERLFELTIRAPAGVRDVRAAAPTDRWLTAASYRSQPVAQWGALGDQMQPGDTSPVLSYTAPGILGIVPAWARGYAPPQPLPPEDTTNRVFHPEPDPVFDGSRIIQVIGVVPPPGGGTGGTVVLAAEQLAQACDSTGWIDSRGVCNSLSEKLAAASASLTRNDTTSARNQLGAFVDELDAQRGKHVSDNAYWLLKTNAEYVLNHL